MRSFHEVSEASLSSSFPSDASLKPPPLSSPRRRDVVAALDEIRAAPIDDIRYFDTPLHCHLMGTNATRQQFVALSFQKQTLATAQTRRHHAGSRETSPAVSTPVGSSTHPPSTDGAAAAAASLVEEELVFRTRHYSAAEAHSLMETLAEQPGVRTGRLRAVLGAVRFLEGYYVFGVTRRQLVARVGPHRIFSVRDVQLLSLTIDPRRLQRVYEETAMLSSHGSRSSAASTTATASSTSSFLMSTAASYVASAVAASSSALVSRRSQEERYCEDFLSQHAHRGFFYSHTYDMTNTLQVNMTTAAPQTGGAGAQGCGVRDDEPAAAPAHTARQRRMKFVWNEFFLEPFAAEDDEEWEGDAGDNEEAGGVSPTRGSGRSRPSRDGDGDDAARSPSPRSPPFVPSSPSMSSHQWRGHREDFAGSREFGFSSPSFGAFWAVFMIRGAVVQRALCTSPSQRRLLVTLIARVSKESAGTRYLRRGVNSDGHVANHVEVEQILCDESSLNGHLTLGAFASYVQVRGSVPVRWYHPPNASMPKPPIIVAEADPFHNASCKHFQELLADYGAPIVAMDFMKKVERHRREAALGEAYKSVVAVLRQAVHEAHVTNGAPETADGILRYHAMDLRHVADRAWNAVTAMAERDSDDIAHFACRPDGSVCSMQSGVVRSSCVDCIDRTNIGQYFFSLHTLGCQLVSLQVLASSTELVLSHGVVEELLAMFLVMGDALATQYGGSAQVGAGVLHRGRGWDQVMGIKRLYANMMGDARKQFVLNLYLGRFQPDPRWHARGAAAAAADDDGFDARRHVRRSRMCNQQMRIIVRRETKMSPRRGGGAPPPSRSPSVTATADTEQGGLAPSLQSSFAVDSAEVGSQRHPAAGATDEDGEHGNRFIDDDASSLQGSVVFVASAAHTAASEARADGASRTRQSVVARLRNVSLNPFAAKTSSAEEDPSKRQALPRRHLVVGGEAEPDYYLQVKRGPQLPSAALLGSWWIAPLQYRDRAAATTARRRSFVNMEDDARERHLTDCAWRERVLSLNPPRQDLPNMHDDKDVDKDEAHVSPSENLPRTSAPTLFETGSSEATVHDRVAHAGDAESACASQWVSLSMQLSAQHWRADDDAGPFYKPIPQVECVHNHQDFPRVVADSLYRREADGREHLCAVFEPGASPQSNEDADAERVISGTLVNTFGPPELWSRDEFVGALRHAAPQLTRATLDAVSTASLDGTCLTARFTLPTSLKALDLSQQRHIVLFVRMMTGCRPGLCGKSGSGDAGPGAAPRPGSPARRPPLLAMNETVRFLQPFFVMRLSNENYLDMLHDWRTKHFFPSLRRRCHSTTHYRFTDQFYPQHSHASDASAPAPIAAAASGGATPPVPLAISVRHSFSALSLLSWLCEEHQRPGTCLTFRRYSTAGANRRAMWAFLWWLLVAGIVRPVVRPFSPTSPSSSTTGGGLLAEDPPPFAGISGARAWEMLSDPTALFRAEACPGGPGVDDVMRAARAPVPRHGVGGLSCEAHPTALAESLCSAALSALSALLRIPQEESAAFTDMATSLAEVLADSAQALRGVSLLSLSPGHLLPFWVNVYNALFAHAWLAASVAPSLRSAVHSFDAIDEDGLAFLRRNGYWVGNVYFTLHDIKYGILCGNASATSECLPPFPPTLYKTSLHRLTPPQLRRGVGSDTSVAEQERTMQLVFLAELMRRSQVEDAGTSCTPAQDMRDALVTTCAFITDDQHKHLLSRTLLALLDAYLPLPLASSAGALVLSLGGAPASSAVNTGDASSTAHAAHARDHTYTHTMRALFSGTALSHRSSSAAPGHDSPPPSHDAVVDVMGCFGFDVSPAADGGLPVRVAQRTVASSGTHAPLAGSPPSAPGLPPLPLFGGGTSTTTHASPTAGVTAASAAKDVWTLVDASGCLHGAAALRRGAARPSSSSLPAPRRVRLQSYDRLHSDAAQRVGGTCGQHMDGTPSRSRVGVPHLCTPLLAHDWQERLLQTEHSFLHTVQSATRASQASALMGSLLAGQPESRPFGGSAAQALDRMQLSHRQGTCAGSARALLEELSCRPALDWKTWRGRLFALVEGLAPPSPENADTPSRWGASPTPSRRQTSPSPSAPAASPFVVVTLTPTR